MTQATAARRPTKAWWKELWVQVMVAMALGIVLGVWRPDLATQMQPFGDAFIKAIRMLIAPIIFCTVVNGIAHMADMAKVGRVAIKAIVYFEVVTTFALIIGLVAVNLWQPGAGMNVDVSTINPSVIEPYVKQTSAVGFVPFLMNIIPNTFVGAFAEGHILQVLFLSVMCGFALIWLGDKAKPMTDVLEVAARMVFGLVRIVMWAAPLGAFGAIAFTVGKFGVGSLSSLGKLIGGFYVTCIIFIAIVLGPIAALCGANLLKLIRYIWEELLVCIATTSSETVLPRMISKLEALGCEKSIVGLVIPTGYSFNLDGTCLYLATAAVFLAQATNTHFDVSHQIGLLLILLVTSKGAAGIAGAAFVVLAATLAAGGTIPVASVALVLGVHRLMSQALTPTNLVGNAVATIVIARWENALDMTQMRRVLDGEPAPTA
ncbi:C4-dicarboxylate transporter DctA [Bradyrhizobium sp. U87765 SZCCT0131]|uniref:C4-dicarboxylate transporter DctA n=1 Tax=unclassified Bradyrhizobium TaxID=2631580 RepID=UPI001BAE17DE|nr:MULTISPECIES: C4-dicarboxylate transporter DctA [unclassified Bradyrhizobium]MBR1221373.1 C4-dicarboxylate transporter DctA [Bradyrhizobium sp. U87765 SZCCT0131]MBR1264704.1 C4-dicarboxylate transporter DctA [Bradyrhizobium sp. U87765 SZCCT0134]MBR1304390.1 C4-dicarboxylate transporter DctA [Bradyrhizobium sp. U87765 SZCCT0110]MBR1322753.1 C4-dicarboxylate transporter DctA [Bradyrhizobium sp. U87765 SZCCT0109]MBR1346319.1 C4-dicarboxylate transporter DctA [Bradyrhizobium sp. U87765 SZCCT004